MQDCRGGIMTSRHRAFLFLFTSLAIAATAFSAVADNLTGAQSPEQIGQQLKTRGLPVLGTVPPPANPAISAANAPSVAPLPKTRKHPARPIHAAAPPRSAAASHPSVTLKAITFEFGSAQLRPESMQELHNLGVALNQILKDEPNLSIEGHTDRKGTATYNMALSKRRADAVKDYLVREMGVPASRLETVGKGFSEPANPSNPYAPENRRVVVVNLGTS
jgi:OmpA-OmpF porin, OOP family